MSSEFYHLGLALCKGNKGIYKGPHGLDLLWIILTNNLQEIHTSPTDFGAHSRLQFYFLWNLKKKKKQKSMVLKSIAADCAVDFSANIFLTVKVSGKNLQLIGPFPQQN